MDAVKFYGRKYARMGGEPVGALYFLHGRKGRCLPEVEPWLASSLSILERDMNVQIDWMEGTVRCLEGGHLKPQRLGKWLQRRGLKALLEKFEKRTPALDWVITCDPAEVLAMSHDRPWTSCMSPGGQYEEGPISDYLAGSALLLFFRTGAGKPCGRELIRPAVTVDGVPVIVRSGTRYGVYGTVPDGDIRRYGEPVVVWQALSELRGLFAGVWDDYAREPGRQRGTDEEASDTLLNAFWPWMRPIPLAEGLDVALRHYQGCWAARALEEQAEARAEARAWGDRIRTAERGRYARSRQSWYASLCQRYGRGRVAAWIRADRRGQTPTLGLEPFQITELTRFALGSRRARS